MSSALTARELEDVQGLSNRAPRCMQCVFTFRLDGPAISISIAAVFVRTYHPLNTTNLPCIGQERFQRRRAHGFGAAIFTSPSAWHGAIARCDDSPAVQRPAGERRSDSEGRPLRFDDGETGDLHRSPILRRRHVAAHRNADRVSQRHAGSLFHDTVRSRGSRHRKRRRRSRLATLLYIRRTAPKRYRQFGF